MLGPRFNSRGFVVAAPEPEAVDIIIFHPQHGQRSIDLRAWKDYEPRGWRRADASPAPATAVRFPGKAPQRARG